jgi:hypothetical protein
MSQSLFANVSMEDYLGVKVSADESLYAASLESEIDASRAMALFERSDRADVRIAVLSAGLESFDGEVSSTTASVIDFAIDSLSVGLEGERFDALKSNLKDNMVSNAAVGLWNRLKAFFAWAKKFLMDKIDAIRNYASSQRAAFKEWRNHIKDLPSDASFKVSIYPEPEFTLAGADRDGKVTGNGKVLTYTSADGKVEVKSTDEKPAEKTISKADAQKMAEEFEVIGATIGEMLVQAKTKASDLKKMEGIENPSKEQIVEAKKLSKEMKFYVNAVVKGQSLYLKSATSIYNAINKAAKGFNKEANKAAK